MKGGEQAAFHRVFFAMRADRVDHVVAFAPFGQEARDGIGSVLHVGIHQHNGVAARAGQAGLDRRLVAEVSGQMDHAHTRVLSRQSVQHLGTVVGAAVVNKKDLVVGAAGGQRLGEAAVQGEQDPRLVVYRQHHADQSVGRGLPSRDRFARHGMFSQVER